MLQVKLNPILICSALIWGGGGGGILIIVYEIEYIRFHENILFLYGINPLKINGKLSANL